MKIKGLFEFDPQLFDEGGAPSGEGGEVKGAAMDGSYDNPGGMDAPGSDASDDVGDPDADFDELIKGKYREQYQNRVNSAINKRLKGNAKEAETGKKIMNAVAMRYGLTDADPDALLNAIESDKNLFDDAAAKAGLSPTQYKRMMELEQEKATRDRQTEQRRKEELKEQYSQQINKQAAECKKLFPNFDIGKELQNKEFADLLRAGIDVTKAFRTVHMDEIMSGGMKMAMQRGTEKVAAAVRQNARRATEGGAGNSPAVSLKVDYGKMTDDEFQKYVEQVKNGEE